MSCEEKLRSINKVGLCLRCGKLCRISLKTCVCGDCAREAI
ncbi:MAG: hypothetical protein ACE5DW_00770 [Thermodesulfobacteriota bacterium]